MNQTTIIGLIVTLIITVGGIAAIYFVVQNHVSGDSRFIEKPTEGQLEITNVITQNISNNGAKYILIEVRNNGAGTLNLNDTFIQLRTEKSTTDLTYRNGDLNRSESTGFYTKDK